jgi:hypothetical protein
MLFELNLSAQENTSVSVTSSKQNKNFNSIFFFMEKEMAFILPE